MEYITEPWQVILLCVVGAVFGVCFWIWLRAGQRGAEVDDAGPVEIIERGWDALINWRPLRVNTSEDSIAVVMSHRENEQARYALSSKDGQGDGRTDSEQIGRTELITLYKVLRKYGVPREEIRPALKGVRVPLSNDVWASAAPADDDPIHVTPIVGRRTSAVFETDPDYPYQAPT